MNNVSYILKNKLINYKKAVTQPNTSLETDADLP